MAWYGWPHAVRVAPRILGPMSGDPADPGDGSADERAPRAAPSASVESDGDERVARLDALGARAAAGDRSALAEALRAVARDVALLCHHVAGPEEGRDAAQAALERLVREASRFDATRGGYRAFALTVARNVCRDRLRRRAHERGAFVDAGDDAVGFAEAPAADPERLAATRQQADRLADALGTLPEGMRTAIVLFHVHEASYDEIARVLEVPLGTVMTWLHRGRQRLRAAAMEAP
jgi:RNA polymerase sigma-70 factor (ECF subfamily)